ncbi:MAG TPA: hypothetical protein PKI14_14900, partial [Fervidobacterium sp.]|nr:hypothetical protein [Fervidobacterium sp.]
LCACKLLHHEDTYLEGYVLCIVVYTRNMSCARIVDMNTQMDLVVRILVILSIEVMCLQENSVKSVVIW